MKKGQVTVYIIVGAILVIIAVAFFAIQSFITEEQVGSVQRVVEQVPEQFIPLRAFTETCLEDTSVQALVLLGQQGGYVNPTGWDNLRFSGEAQTDADGLLIAPNSSSGLGIPYWSYNIERNNRDVIRFGSHQPTLRSMEEDIARFVEEEIPNCLNNYVSFDEQGFVVEQSAEFDAAVRIVPGSVRISLRHPISASLGDAQSQISQFASQIQLDLLHYYTIAEQITQVQQNYSVLEHHALNMIEISSDTEPDALPPMSDNTFNLVNTAQWSTAQVEEDLEDVLGRYMSLLRVQNTLNFVDIRFPVSVEGSRVKQGVADTAIIPFDGAQDVEVSFNYNPDWDIFMRLNTESENVQPQTLSIFYEWFNFGFQRFKTVYDVSFPVYAQINDPNAFNGRGYTFNFALEGNVRNNRLPEEGVSAPVVSEFDRNLLCDVENRASGTIRIKVSDRFTKNIIPNASIYYTVGDTSCTLGPTDDTGTLITTLPVAIGGVITVAHHEYMAVGQNYDASIGEDDNVEFELWKFKNIELQFVKQPIYNCKVIPEFRQFVGVVPGETECFLPRAERFEDAPPANPLSAVIQEEAELLVGRQSLVAEFDVEMSQRALTSEFHHIAADAALEPTEVGVYGMELLSEDLDHAVAVEIQGSQTRIARMVPGTYEVNANLLLAEPLSIPDDERCDYDPPTDSFLFCVDVDEIDFEQLPSGGVSKLEVTIDPAQFYGSERIILPVLSVAYEDVAEQRRVIEDAEILGKIEELSQQKASSLQPRYR